jgi:dynein regulatory complex subunit 2
VLLDKLAIEREQARLEQENAELQAIVQQYLEGVSVSASVMNEPNALLVVNGRVNLTRRLPVVRAYPTPAIEAVHMVETGRVNTRVGL